MIISHININNFKSLVNSSITLPRFSCLIGLNGVGKSTVLQFIDFLGQQVRGDISSWLGERHWRPRDLPSRLSSRKNVEFYVNLAAEGGARFGSWQASFNTAQRHCTEESIAVQGAVLRTQNGRLRIEDTTNPRERLLIDERISFSYEGSILSQLRQAVLPPPLIEFKEHLAGVRSFDLLSPENLRQRTRDAADSIGRGGKGLSSFLHAIGSGGREQLTSRLRKIYPHLDALTIKSQPSGKQLEIHESYGGSKVVTEARHINDGMLRLIAILAELQDNHHHFLLFDEIENGINPELVEFLLDALVSAPRQVMVTTHSPLILNYLDDEVARDSVIYIYKTEQGHTRTIPFFSIPSLAEKLKFMGPGEAFADTDLTALRHEIHQVPQEP